MTPEERKIEKLLKLAELADEDYASMEEVAEIMAEIVAVIRSNKEENNKLVGELATEISNRLEELTITGKENYLKSEELVNKAKQATLSEIKILTRQLNDEIKRVQGLIPRLPDLSFLERKINEVERKIPIIPKVEEVTPEQVRDKLESLTNDERLDVSAIKGIEDLIKQFANTLGIGKVFAAGVNLFSHLNDTPDSYTGQAGKVVAVNADENGVEFIDNTGAVGSISNLGAGEGIFAQINSGDAQFKSLVAGTNVTLNSNANTITINASASGGSDTWVTDDLTDDVDGILDTFSLSQTPKTGSPFFVYLSGVLQRPTYYSVTGTDLAFTFVPPEDTELLVYYIQE